MFHEDWASYWISYDVKIYFVAFSENGKFEWKSRSDVHLTYTDGLR